MPIPDYQSIMLPLLRFAGDGEEHSLQDTIAALADEFRLTDDERRELLPSGRQATFDNRVGWARTYLKKARLLKSTRRGYYQIAERGTEVLRQSPPEIIASFLKRFPEFVEFQKPQRRSGEKVTDHGTSDTQTPEEEIEAAYQRVRQGLSTELLQTVKECSPSFFERLVIDLLVKMGMVVQGETQGRPLAALATGGLMALSRKIDWG